MLPPPNDSFFDVKLGQSWLACAKAILGFEHRVHRAATLTNACGKKIVLECQTLCDCPMAVITNSQICREIQSEVRLFLCYLVSEPVTVADKVTDPRAQKLINELQAALYPFLVSCPQGKV